MSQSREENATDPLNPADVRYAAMNLLARREHSQRELIDKLGQRFPDRDLVAHEIARLADENLQSDTRFAESFVRQRISRGYGPLRLRQEMGQRGISESALETALSAVDADWFSLAEQVYEKKFGAVAPRDLAEKAKRARFMSYRGFVRDHFGHLIEGD